MSSFKLEKEPFGTTADGRDIERYTLRNARGAKVRLITHGATVTELWMPDRQRNLADIVLGFDDLPSYESNPAYFGCVVGRVAFRIHDGEFCLDEKKYELAKNAQNAHMHGGPKGFSKVVWQAEPVLNAEVPGVKFSYRSPDGDQGYPGTLNACVIYSLTDNNELRIEYTAKTDKPTIVNLTHHSYFNLAGAGNGTILDHEVQLDADRFIPAGEPGIPSGEIVPVRGTPFDFSCPTAIGARLDQTGGDPLGYDFCYLRNATEGILTRVADVREKNFGRRMEVWTTEPAFVFYTANYLDSTLRGKDSKIYPQHAALCLETGRPPDAIHHPGLPSIILRPEETYRHLCAYRFSAE